MESDYEKVDVKFELPYNPYPNQIIFMRDAYECFEKSRFGLFESPTGSGKTLSILCSALTWLKNNRIKMLMRNLDFDASRDNSVPNWVSENAFNQQRLMAEDMVALEAKMLENLRKKISEKIDNSNGILKLRNGYKRGLSNLDLENDELKEFNVPNKTQIIICSRTFSQLNQYVKEFRKLDNLIKNVRLAIGSGRTHVCINNTVKNKCKNSEELNDECRRTKCEFRTHVNELTEVTSCYPLDLEDLTKLGKEMVSCPYYSNISSIKNADVILAPYVTIINESMRESLGIRIKNNILIFDEGHNLIDAITESHSCKISLMGLKELLFQLKGYVKKYMSKINGLTYDRVSQIINLVDTLVSNLSKIKSSDNFKITSFTVIYSLDDFKFHEILNFLSSTEFCRHLRGFSERIYHAKKKEDENIVSYTSMIYTLKNFIYSLLYCDSNDQVIITHLDEDVLVEIFPVASVENSRSVIIMSGTLSPIEEFLSLAPSKCDRFIHKSPPVFSQDRFLTTILDRDNKGDELLFDYSRRENVNELQYLCELIEMLSANVPNGIVCFFSSYSYLNSFYNYFMNSSSKVKVLSKKYIFKEQKNINVFPQYSKKCIERGAILFAVFGGNQSEGVDFADGLARLVLLIGIPYPPDSVKLKLKREYYSLKALESKNELISENYNKLSNEQRTLLCYKIINQCIGRAMRHKGDYAVVILLDSRYRNKNCNQYLSGYVRKSILINENKGEKDLSLLLQNFYKRLA